MIDALLKKVMQECKLRQPELAALLGASLDRVKGLTSGRVKNLTREESEALIGKLGIRANWLITGEEPMFQEDEEAQDAFVDRMQGIKRMTALIKSMPLSDHTKLRLPAVMTGDAAQDGPIVYEAISKELAGVDFVTGKRIEGVTPTIRPLPADEQMWLDCYREWSPEVKKHELRRAMGVSPSGAEQTAHSTPSMGSKNVNNNQSGMTMTNSTPGGVQVGYAGGKVSVKKGR